ncbi:MAG: flavodoxin family protein [Bacillota bacterium]
MKALMIMGSPRRKMNSDILLDRVIEGLAIHGAEVEKIYVKDLKIHPCTACDYCGRTGQCCFQDDMLKLYTAFDKADIIVIASPLYFNSVSSQIKTMIDRCQMFWSSKYTLGKSSIEREKKRKGAFICTAGSKQKDHGFIGAEVVMDLFFKSINTDYQYRLFVDDTDNNFVNARAEIMEKAYRIGEMLVNK